MVQAVDAHLETVLPEVVDYCIGNVVAQGDEVPGRAKAALSLDVSENVDVAVPKIGLHIVGEDERPALTVRPGCEARDGFLSDLSQHAEYDIVEMLKSGLDRPLRKPRAALNLAEDLSQPDLRAARQDWARGVVAAKRKRARKASNTGLRADVAVALAPAGTDGLVWREREEGIAVVGPLNGSRATAVGQEHARFGRPAAPVEHRLRGRIRKERSDDRETVVECVARGREEPIGSVAGPPERPSGARRVQAHKTGLRPLIGADDTVRNPKVIEEKRWLRRFEHGSTTRSV